MVASYNLPQIEPMQNALTFQRRVAMDSTFALSQHLIAD